MGTNENETPKAGKVIDPMHPAEDKTGVQVGTLAKSHRFRLTKKMAFGVCVILLVIVLSAVAIQHKTNSSKGELKQAQTVEQELNSMVQNIKNNAPADNASTAEKTAYYDKLVVAYGKSENYKAAIAAFETREAISADGITYLDYIIAAKYYQRVGDHTKASQALDNAVKVAPKDGDPEAGYTYQTVINRIAEARTELGL